MTNEPCEILENNVRMMKNHDKSKITMIVDGNLKKLDMDVFDFCMEHKILQGRYKSLLHRIDVAKNEL